jgi:thymidylate synthase (FAD)
MKAQYIAHYLTDSDIANIARQSFAGGTRVYTDEENNNLIRYLARGVPTKEWENLKEVMATYISDDPDAHDMAVKLRNIPEHWVPFGHPQITLRMQAPIPIRVQCFKHKIGFVESEESRRYISSMPELYIPETFRAKGENVKQGSGDAHERSTMWRSVYIETAGNALLQYNNMIIDGVCPEQARFILPQGCEVNWVWTGSLYAFANMYKLRSDPHAQKEIRDLADEIDKIIAPLFPVAWAALAKGEY